jgi:threonine synthase
LTYLCTSCARQYDNTELRWRCDCGGVLELESPHYDGQFCDPSSTGVWRYPWLLPDIDPRNRISLGEPTTPLITSSLLGAHLKLDYLLPSGSYKDRGATVMVSHLHRHQVRKVTLDSSGNAGAAAATYCGAAGIACEVFVPASNSPAKLAQISALGAHLTRVPGTRLDTTIAAQKAAAGGFYASHNWSPEFEAGLSTVAAEIYEQLGGRAPTTVLAPCGNGGVILGLHRGFDALLRAGLIPRLPRLVAVQSEFFDAVTHAVASGADQVDTRGVDHTTIAEGIACARPVRWRQLLNAIRTTGGDAISVTEGEIQTMVTDLASRGIFVEPTGAVAAAGLRQMRNRPDNALGGLPVVVLTGFGLKAAAKIAELRDPNWVPGESR